MSGFYHGNRKQGNRISLRFLFVLAKKIVFEEFLANLEAG